MLDSRTIPFVNHVPYPRLDLKNQLLEEGVPEDKHHLAGMKAILTAHFDFSQVDHLHDANETAEILLYLIKKKLLKIRKNSNPGPA
jgi:hypothetical protein